MFFSLAANSGFRASSTSGTASVSGFRRSTKGHSALMLFMTSTTIRLPALGAHGSTRMPFKVFSSDPAELLVVGDVPLVDLVAVQAQDLHVAHAGGDTATFEGEGDAAPRSGVVTGQNLQKLLTHPGQRELEVVVAEIDGEVVVLARHKFPEAVEHRLERIAACDGLELLLGGVWVRSTGHCLRRGNPRGPH